MDPELLEVVSSLNRGRAAYALATVVETQGSASAKPSSKALIDAQGRLLTGWVGGGCAESAVCKAALDCLETGEATIVDIDLSDEVLGAGMPCGGRMRVFLEKHGAAAHLWIFGAGHVAKELATLAQRVGFRVHVVDERAQWASRERFPDAELKLEHPADVARAHPGGRDCFFCVTTHDHPLDQACVEALLRKTAAYVGVIGSRRKAETDEPADHETPYQDEDGTGLRLSARPSPLPLRGASPGRPGVELLLASSPADLLLQPAAGLVVQQHPLAVTIGVHADSTDSRGVENLRFLVWSSSFQARLHCLSARMWRNW